MCERETLKDSLISRFACKEFDSYRDISKLDLDFILEAGRMAPSSFGMEPWKFLVIKNIELKDRLRGVCWNQAQISDCSALVVIVSQIKSVSNKEYYTKIFERRGLSEDMTKAYIKRYEEYISKLPSIPEWVAKQCYIAMDHMLIYASLIGIDSCPIEGFESNRVDEILGLDSISQKTTLLLPLGYCLKEPTQKRRHSFNEVVSFV